MSKINTKIGFNIPACDSSIKLNGIAAVNGIVASFYEYLPVFA